MGHPTLLTQPTLKWSGKRDFPSEDPLGGKNSIFPAAFHSGPPPPTLPPRVSPLAPVHLHHRGPWAPSLSSPEPRCGCPPAAGLRWDTSLCRFHLVLPSPGAWVWGVKGPQKEIGRFVGGLGSVPRSQPFHPIQPQSPATFLGSRVMVNWVESLRTGQADGDLLGKGLLGVTAYSHLCLQQPIPRPMPQ